MDEQGKQTFEEWFKSSNIGKGEKHIALAAWEAGRESMKIANRAAVERAFATMRLSAPPSTQSQTLFGKWLQTINPDPVNKPIPPRERPIEQHMRETGHNFFFVQAGSRKSLLTCSRCGKEVGE